ncbi:hypothetical protein VP1G_10153 [Cytospora mali]|uniref:Uncharacterized protein n=1 Tax=Cytospora mali TaxID=578113 RepID=A0A194VG95_CYTMA|nr:hypothetical protein VP1G_10153 [Valsa mali var. pyri (nom. inval.)]
MPSTLNFLLLLVLLLMDTVSANSLLFYSSADNCNISSDHIGCYMHPANICCNSHAPFCVNLMLGLGASSAGNDYTQYFVHQDNCHLSKNGGSYCTQGGPNNAASCCIDMPHGGGDGATCSGFWLHGDTGASPHGWKEGTHANGGCMDPNYMSYNDGFGVKKIFLPNGTFQHALDAYNRNDFSVLAGYKALVEVMGNDTDIV